jgi:hypothetical protein
MLYELLCRGNHPYDGSRATIGDAVIDPQSIRPDLPDDLARFLMKACAPSRDERFTTALEMKGALEAIEKRQL